MTQNLSNIFGWRGENTPDKMIVGYDPTYTQPYWAQPELGGLFSRRQDRYAEIHKWCEDTFGAHTDSWKNPRWSASNRKYWFKYEKDRTLFVMRWS